MNQHPYAATTYAQTLTDVWKALNDPLMTLGPDVIAAAIAALNIYALAELLCPARRHHHRHCRPAAAIRHRLVDRRRTCREHRSARRALSTDRQPR